MLRKPVSLNWEDIPDQFHTFLDGAAIFDSSWSADARVYFLDKGPGFYLKRAPKNTMQTEGLECDRYEKIAKKTGSSC